MMLLINPDLLIDKLYQGLKFSMFKSINDHRLPSPKGKQFKNLPEFLSLLGTEFSEEFLAGDTLRRCLCSNVDIFKDGKELKQNGVQGESDFYIRKGQSLMIVEYKDVILSDTKKNSDDINELKRAILDKICLDNGNNRKGVGQVLWNIDRVLNGEYSIVDPEYNIVRKIYQIILVTDNVFSSHGVTKLVIEESNKIIKKYTFGNKFISVPIILDIDTLISLSYWLNIGKYDIFDLFDDYLIKNQGNILSFKRYVAQYYLSGKQWIADKSNRLQFMFGDILV
jgi:hypothetical protein